MERKEHIVFEQPFTIKKFAITVGTFQSGSGLYFSEKKPKFDRWNGDIDQISTFPRSAKETGFIASLQVPFLMTNDRKMS
jgi:hypothetical protein